MNLGNNLFNLRKKCGLSQEEVAEKLGVSRQTISKWETSETTPDIYQAKKMARLYNVSLDELIDFDIEINEVLESIDKVKDSVIDKIDWSKAWSKKYPILIKYLDEVNIDKYAINLEKMLKELEDDYHYNKVDSVLVLKDILYRVLKAR